MSMIYGLNSYIILCKNSAARKLRRFYFSSFSSGCPARYSQNSSWNSYCSGCSESSGSWILPYPAASHCSESSGYNHS